MQSGLLVQDFAIPLSAGFRKGAKQNENNPPRKIPHGFGQHSISEAAACLDEACETLRSMSSCMSGRNQVKPHDLSRC